MHGTQKPVECMRRPIVNNSSPGQAVYEPFCGSGTTHHRRRDRPAGSAIAIELIPAYVDVAVKRWQEFTGKAATLERDSRTFAGVAGERSGAETVSAELRSHVATPGCNGMTTKADILAAIRRKCLDCCCQQPGEVRALSHHRLRPVGLPVRQRSFAWSRTRLCKIPLPRDGRGTNGSAAVRGPPHPVAREFPPREGRF